MGWRRGRRRGLPASILYYIILRRLACVHGKKPISGFGHELHNTMHEHYLAVFAVFSATASRAKVNMVCLSLQESGCATSNSTKLPSSSVMERLTF
jgi:hypothetical protein